MKLHPLKIKSPAAEIRGQPLPQMPVYPSGLRGYTGRVTLPSSDPHSKVPGRVGPPRHPLKKGDFWGFPGASPGLDLIILQHRKCCIFN
jgi:hypothetical protein